MTVALTLVVRDEAEILGANLEYHLAAGVDVVLVTDHRSVDGTREILEDYRRSGVVRVFRKDADLVEQARWQTRMARVAFAEHGAEWVLLGDTDEFWWPYAGSLGEALGRVPIEYGVVHGLQRNFVPLRGEGSSFSEHMVVRLSMPAPINDPATPFRPVSKVAVRPGPNIVVGKGGGHQVFGYHGESLQAWHPLEILHFPLRSREQSARKYEKTWTGWRANPRGDLARARQAADTNRSDAMWERLALDDAAVRQGVEDGSLVVDTRLRDVLRGIQSGGSRVAFDRSDDPHQLFALAFAEAELVRRQRWLDDLERRVQVLRDPRPSRRVRAR